MNRWAQRAVGLIMMVTLAGLPATATACAALCESAVPHTPAAAAMPPATAMHHGSGASCHESATPGARHVMTASAHDCGSHDEAVQEAEAALTTVRSSAQTLVAVTFAITAHPAHLASNIRFAPSSHEPPLVLSAARTPLVLRV